jgi:hypothetical protein
MGQGFHNTFKSPDIVSVIKVCGLEWLTYVVRLGGERTVKKAKQEEGEEQEDLDENGLMMSNWT